MSELNVRNKSPFASLLLATILAAGAWVTWLIVALVTYTVSAQFFAAPRPSSNLSFTIDGQPILQSWSYPNYAKVITRTLDGRTIDDPDSLAMQEESYLNTDLPGPRAALTDRLAWSLRIRGWLVLRPSMSYWYLIHDNDDLELVCLVGYDAETKRLMGYIGRNGFRVAPPPADEHFVVKNYYYGTGGAFAPAQYASYGQQPYSRAPAGQDGVFIVSAGALYRVDLRRQAVRQIPTAEDVVSVGTVAEITPVPDDRHAVYKQRFVVRFADRLQILDPSGEVLHEISLPQEVRPYNFTVHDTTGEDWIAVRNAGGAWNLPTDIYWISPRGELARREQVRLFPEPTDNLRMVAWYGAALLPMPVPFACSALVSPFLKQGNEELLAGIAEEPPLDASPASLAEILAVAWLPLLVVCGVSAVAAAVCYRHHRRCAGKGAVAWAAFVFVLGLPGLAGYWLHRRWPTAELCASCGRTMPRDRHRCLVCEAEFPLPALRGIEIFS